jgi:hypothetical protein
MVGTRRAPLDAFLQENVQDGMTVVPQGVGTKLYESYYGGVPMEAYLWDSTRLSKTEAGKRVLSCIDKEGIVPSSLAWEFLKKQEEPVIIAGAEMLPDSFVHAIDKGEFHLVGDPFRAKEPTAVTELLRQGAPNEIGVPLDLLVRLRDLGFWLGDAIPIDESVPLVDKVPEDDQSWVSVVVPSWAEMQDLDWATHARFPKDDFPVFLYAAGLVKRLGPNEALGRILEACTTKFTSKSFHRRGTPVDTATEVAKMSTAAEFSAATVPPDLASLDIGEFSTRSPNSWNYPRGGRNRVSTVWTLMGADYVVALPPAGWWKSAEKGWYLYRAATSARKGVLFL